jgi:hypothetical protein
VTYTRLETREIGILSMSDHTATTDLAPRYKARSIDGLDPRGVTQSVGSTGTSVYSGER